MRRLTFPLLFCLLTALVAAGCGSSDESVDSLLKETFASDTSVKSGRLNAQVDANVQGVANLNGPLRLRLSGPFQSGEKNQMPRFDFTLGITASGQSFNAGGVSTGEKGYVRFQDKTYVVSDQLFKQFKDGYLAAAKASQKDQKSKPSLATLGIDPRSWLRDARKAGEQEVGGTDTFHITAAVDVPRMLEDVNRLLSRAGSASGSKQVQQLTPAQRKQIQDAVQSATVDVYTGKDDKLLRRLDVKVALKQADKLKGGNLRFQLQLDALNKDQDINEPQNARPLEELTGAATGTTGGAAPSTPAPSTPAPSSGGGSSNSEYLKCLQDAGRDIRKAQQCAELVGR
jgi:hypothetical protein